MRRLFPFLFLLVTACFHKPGSDTDLKSWPFVADSAKHRLLKIINGGWVCRDYADTFYKWLSPVKANGRLPVLQLVFDTSRLNGDTMYNGFHHKIYSSIERFDVVFEVQNGAVRMIPKLYPYNDVQLEELGYQINAHDTLLVLSIGGIKYSFEKVFNIFPDRQKIELSALDLFANRFFDSFEWGIKGKTCFFNDDGTVNGFEKFTRYSVKVKAEYPQSESDEITFYNDSLATTFAYRLIVNPDLYMHETVSLELFDLVKSKDETEISRDALRYTLQGTYFAH